MRVTSEFWVSALIRRAQGEGAYATVVHKGATEAGAIFIIVSNLSGEFALYGPAPQVFYSDDVDQSRIFEKRLVSTTEDEVNAVVERELSFDPDIWAVEIEDREGRSFINP